jgi:opacity protein-like surface antigen
MKILKLTTLALALSGAGPTLAAEPDAKAPPAAPAGAGMTAEQQAAFDRIAIKAEALEDGRDASGLKGFKFSGYMDPAYVYNFNKQRGSFEFLAPIIKEPYGYDAGYFGTLAIDVVKETDSGTKFHLTLYPKRGGGDVMGENSIVHEASVWIPLGGLSTKLFAGQLPDWSGYEYYAPNLYKNVTHNLLFDFTLPSAYTGAGIELIRGKWDLKFMVANMNSSIRAVGEQIPMFVFRGDYTGGEFWGFGFAGAEGYKSNFRPFVDSGFGQDANGVALDAAGNPVSTKDTRYDSFEIDGWYNRGDVTLNAHVGVGQQQKAAITADATTGNLRTAQWIGVSVLAAYKFTPRTEGVLRGDYVYNQKNGGGLLDYTIADAGNGIGPDLAGDLEKGANRYAITAGLNYALNSNVTLKGEYRFDGANLAVFGNKAALTSGGTPKYLKYNSLIATSAVFFF